MRYILVVKRYENGGEETFFFETKQEALDFIEQEGQELGFDDNDCSLYELKTGKDLIKEKTIWEQKQN